MPPLLSQQKTLLLWATFAVTSTLRQPLPLATTTTAAQAAAVNWTQP
jgi:hypothetical protein